MADWMQRSPEIARRHCVGDRGTGRQDCTGYHAVRPLLYSFGLRTSFDTYRDMFAAVCQQGAGPVSSPRVLISGSADFVVPAVVTGALRAIGRQPRVTIVDHCPTPLLMCTDAGARLSMDWETVRRDVRDPRLARGYHLIVSDRLLGFIPRRERAQVVSAWRSQLADDGRVVATVSISPGRDAPDAGDESLVREITTHLATRYGPALPGVSPRDLIDMVHAYNADRRRHRARDMEEILPLFEQCGLRITGVQEFTKKTDAGLAVDKARRMLRIVAGPAA